jgi:hypothetical protein
MRAELEPVGTEWINVQTFFSDDTAMGEFLAFEQSRYMQGRISKPPARF